MEIKYPLPLYLNQKYVFDLLAMMEGGLTLTENVKSQQSAGGEKHSRLSADVGAKNMFALIGLNIGGEKESKQNQATSEESTREKTHTPNSLFAKMRENLYSENLVRDKDIENTKLGEFVEFSVTLKKNPLIEVFETIGSVMRLAHVFEPVAGQKKSGQPGHKKPDGAANTKQILAFVDEILKQLNSSGSSDLIGNLPAQSNMGIVLTLDTDYLNDPTMSDIIDGQYRILGRVAKILRKGDSERINLLRKTSFGKMQSGLLDNLKASLDGEGLGGIELPKLITEFEGPTVQVIPIAVFI